MNLTDRSIAVRDQPDEIRPICKAPNPHVFLIVDVEREIWRCEVCLMRTPPRLPVRVVQQGSLF